MIQTRALIVHSLAGSLSTSQGLLEKRGLAVAISRTLAEAERLYTNAVDPFSYVFIDTTLMPAEGWDTFLSKMRGSTPETVFLFFNPNCPKTLYDLFNYSPSPPPDEGSAEASRGVSIIGRSPRLREALDLARRYAMHDITVLITGETGTGKEMMAQFIHEQGARRKRPFVACNLASVPETLLESELFGYVRGAFTGADREKRGLVEAAEGGTLLLDEIGDLSPSLQLKLLRLAESREYYKVGDSAVRTADVRIIAATNKDLDQAIREDDFRMDLFYRLNSGRIIVPPLRERKEDLMLLAEHFVAKGCQRLDKPEKKISSSVSALLSEYSWPGNIRELKNVIENGVMVSNTEFLTMGDLPMHLQQYAVNHRDVISTKAIRKIDQAEKELIEKTLEDTNGNKTEAAEKLGISTRTLYRKLMKFSVPGAA